MLVVDVRRILVGAGGSDDRFGSTKLTAVDAEWDRMWIRLLVVWAVVGSLLCFCGCGVDR